jgi:hypothetical protein
MAFTCADWAHQGKVLADHPCQTADAVQRVARDRGRAAVELLQCLADREHGILQPGPGVGGLPGGDLGVN